MQDGQAILGPRVYGQREFRVGLLALWSKKLRKQENGVRSMVDKQRKKNGQGAKRPRLKYFYVNGDLHRKIYINRGRDLLNAWNYAAGREVTYTYSDVLRRMDKAFTTKEVGMMVNRSRVTIENALVNGMIEKPQHAYTEDKNKVTKYLWHEKDIMDLLDYLSSIHRGRPRKDGVVTITDLPTPRELRAMIHDEAILYVKQGDTFVPSWRAKELT